MLRDILIILTTTLIAVQADNPTNCSFEDTLGKWIISLGADGQNNTLDCSKRFETVNILQIELLFPNSVVDENGNVGTWTMVYNQGFAIELNGRRYFAFQYYEQTSPTTVVSYCDRTFTGWVHDEVSKNVFPPKNWGCYSGRKLKSTTPKVVMHQVFDYDLNTPYSIDQNYIHRINQQQKLWTAGIYEEHANHTLNDMIRKAGGKMKFSRIRPSPISTELQELADSMPESFDWREFDMISPVRNQGSCGSCYAFASMAGLEAGVRIATKGRIQVVFSPQYIVSCSNYSQGCDGGFPYLIAGMFGQDFGVIQEDCYPYLGNDTKTCSPVKQGFPIYTTEYNYVGGFYGACNEALMKVALRKIGPIMVGFNVTSDFFQYKGGIYHHTGLEPDQFGFNPFELTNHAVLVVGYGVDQDSFEKYWIVKNSWGTGWGEDGYFRIRRGTDELGIESLAVYAKPWVGV